MKEKTIDGKSVKSFGLLSTGEESRLYKIQNKNGMLANVTDYGAALVSLYTKDRQGQLADIVLGYDSVSGYEEFSGCFGGTIGRNANRIKDGKCVIDGVTYRLEKNNNGNNLHSGPNGYHKRLWNLKNHKKDSITFSLLSPNKDQGYPGELKVELTYSLTENDELILEYFGVSDKKTVFNLTNHTYFNLKGHDQGDILEHKLQLTTSLYTPADSKSIPYGTIEAVDGTPMDFRLKKAVGQDISADFEQLQFGGGYDHNYVIPKRSEEELVFFAKVEEDTTGRVLLAYTNSPGVQFYTGNHIHKDVPGKNNALYQPRQGLCLETQYYPDSINQIDFPSPIINPGVKKRYKTVYKFSTRD